VFDYVIEVDLESNPVRRDPLICPSCAGKVRVHTRWSYEDFIVVAGFVISILALAVAVLVFFFK
jgi:hypothetical protein